MEIIEFHVQGSAEQPYRVTFHRIENRITASCTCPAGQNGQLCKHRILILQGSKEKISSGNVSDVEVVAKWLRGTELEKAIAESGQVEVEVERLKKRAASLKKKLSAILLGQVAA